jgi:hypothetical protein
MMEWKEQSCSSGVKEPMDINALADEYLNWPISGLRQR